MNKADLEEQLSQNETMLHVVKQTKHSSEVVEGYARKELGLKKKGEVYYQIIED